MAIDVQALRVTNNVAENRFEVPLEDKFGFVEYRKEGPDYILVHTEVPEEFGGQGIAQHLVHETLELIKAEGGQIVVLCPYVKSYLRKHPEYESMVVEIPEE